MDKAIHFGSFWHVKKTTHLIPQVAMTFVTFFWGPLSTKIIQTQRSVRGNSYRLEPWGFGTHPERTLQPKIMLKNLILYWGCSWAMIGIFCGLGVLVWGWDNTSQTVWKRTGISTSTSVGKHWYLQTVYGSDWLPRKWMVWYSKFMGAPWSEDHRHQGTVEFCWPHGSALAYRPSTVSEWWTACGDLHPFLAGMFWCWENAGHPSCSDLLSKVACFKRDSSYFVRHVSVLKTIKMLIQYHVSHQLVASQTILASLGSLLSPVHNIIYM